MRILPVILFSLVTLSCSALPNRPDLFVCTLSVQFGKLYCTKSVSGDKVEFPIEQGDKFVCMSPPEWVTLNSYIKDLRSIVEKGCRK